MGSSGPVHFPGGHFDRITAPHDPSGFDHEVSLVGYVDDASYPTGGYWIIKNSWGTGEGVNGYDYIPYGNIEVHNDIRHYRRLYLHRTDVPVGRRPFSGTAATNTWKGMTNGVWDTTSGTSGNWANNSTGGTFTWVNQELQAIFDNTSNSATGRSPLAAPLSPMA